VLAYSGVSDPTTVNGSSLLLQLFLVHPNASNLALTLTSPSGTTVTVLHFNEAPSHTRELVNGTVWTDASWRVLANVTEVWTIAVALQPSQSFAPFNGGAVNGDWTLVVANADATEFGILQSWYLDVQGLTCPSDPCLANSSCLFGVAGAVCDCPSSYFGTVCDSS